MQRGLRRAQAKLKGITQRAGDMARATQYLSSAGSSLIATGSSIALPIVAGLRTETLHPRTRHPRTHRIKKPISWCACDRRLC